MTPWPLAPSNLDEEQFERYERGMSPEAEIEDRLFYLLCRFDGHQQLISQMQGEIFDLVDRNRRNVLRAWHYRQDCRS